MSDKKFVIRTEVNKKPVIFASIIGSLAAICIVIFAIVEKSWAIKIPIFILCGVFVVLSIVLLLYLTLDYIKIDGEYIIAREVFARKKVLITSIKKVVYKKELYIMYLDNNCKKKFATLNSFDPMANQIIVVLERNGVKVIN